MRTSRLSLRVLVAITMLLASALALPAAAQAQSPPPWLRIEDGVTQPVFDPANAIEETVYVESQVDSDDDGRRDRVRIRISRPGEAAAQGLDVPVIFHHSPYRGEFGSPANNPVDFPVLPQEFLGRRPGPARGATAARASRRRALDLPGRLDDFYVPRGYAVVLGESIGTAGSDGCPTVGDLDEALAGKAVIDWLNGRARAFDADGDPVRADWTTGDVGMWGVSYDGTLPNMVATTGVEGLRTIVPIAAISSWYDYYRANGLVVAPHSRQQALGENVYLGEDTDVLALFTAPARLAGPCAHVLLRLREQQDRTTGDFNAFWRERDYLRRAGGVRASALVVHGLADWNVRSKQWAAWWERLAANGVERKLLLHQRGHTLPRFDPEFERTEHRWFDHELFGVDNGITQEPRAVVQRPDGSFTRTADWPVPGTSPATLHLGATTATEPGTLETAPVRSGPRPAQRFVDRGRELDTDEVLIADPDRPNPNRLVYLTAELPRDVHLSGTPVVALRASVDNRHAANLTAVLVDYGPFGSTQAPHMVTRGWLDPQNRQSIARSVPIEQGRRSTLRFDLQPHDHVFAAGHRIGLVVVSTDHDHTMRPAPGTELTVVPSTSELRLPVVGGIAELGF